MDPISSFSPFVPARREFPREISLIDRISRYALACLLGEGILALSVAALVLSLPALLLKKVFLFPPFAVGITFGLSCLAIAAVLYRERYEIWYKVSMIVMLIREKLGLYQWFTPIDRHCTLGGTPLQVPFDRVRERHPSLAVLSVTQSFEVDNYLVDLRDIPRKRLHVKDFDAPSQAQIQEGLSWINEQIQEGRHVYVHCRGGFGRSACIMACYLRSYDALKALRPQVHFNAKQRACVEEFLKEE